MYSRSTRVARGSVVAAIATLVAACSHAAGGGAFPSPLLLLAGLVISAAICIPLAGRRVTLLRTVPSVLATQALFHLLFSTGGGGEQEGVLAGTGHAGHLGHDPVVALLTDSAGAGAGAGAAGAAPMTIAHLTAAVLTILALRYGEAAFWGLLDTARLMVTAALRIVIPLGVAPRVAGASSAYSTDAVRARSADRFASVRRRGPPPALSL